MNIFAVHKNPKICAQQHCNKHLIKQILEHSQLLSTAHRVLDGEQVETVVTNGGRRKISYVMPDERETLIYKVTHINHPSAIWARDNLANYLWLCHLTAEMLTEYTYRYSKVHACSELVKYFLNNPPKNINQDSSRFTYPTPAMPDHCKVPGDVIQSYRNYYIMEKQRMADWSGKIAGRPVPDWFVFTEEEKAA